MLKGIVIGIILGVIVLAGGAYYYFASGMAPVQFLASISFARELGACVDSAELGRQIAQSESCLNPGSHANFGPQALSRLSGVSQQFRREASLDSALALSHSASLADYFQFYDSLGGIEYAPNPCGSKPCPTFHAVGPFAFES